MDRVQDLISELEYQVEPLKEQAEWPVNIGFYRSR